MSTTHNCPCTQACPLQRAMEMIGGKWKLSLLCSLMVDGSTRYNELKRKMNGISNTMLAATLKDLEERKLVARIQYNEIPPRVEYMATERAKSLRMVFEAMVRWAEECDP